MITKVLTAAVLFLASLSALPAMQYQDLDLISPLTGAHFPAVGPMAQPGGAPAPADMGVDVDGCRHSSGPCEYDYYVVVDPFTYFGALTSEWDARSGKFLSGEVRKDIADWLAKEFGGEREIDWNHAFQGAIQVARNTGAQPPDRSTFVVPQTAIPVDKRYRLALASYEKRGARNLILAKIALTGAWALRCRAQVPIAHPQLAGGFEEVNARVGKNYKDGETFDVAKAMGIYRKVVDDDGLSREGYTVAALALFGFHLRDGDLEACRADITKALDRLGKDDKPDMLRGLVRDRKKLLEDHNKLLNIANERFILALRNEEVVRSRIPEVMLVVAESFRRLGNNERAADWYLALGKLPETQPSARAELHFQGKDKALPADKPYHVQLGWIADEGFDRLRKAGISNAGEIAGSDKGLLLAILNEGLGTAAYSNPGWRPATGATPAETGQVLNMVGMAVLDHAYRLGSWPKSLGELWEHEIIRDRNQVNRFCDPSSGKAMVYREPPGDFSHLDKATVLVATGAPVDTPQGPRYGAFLANMKIAWSETPPVIGQPFAGN